MIKINKIFVFIFLCFCVIQIYSQEVKSNQISKDVICRGAAVSVVGNVKPFIDLNFTKSKIIALTKDLVKPSIKEAPSKAYELFKANKTRKEVIEILYNDFMKLDDNIVSQFLINCPPDDEY